MEQLVAFKEALQVGAGQLGSVHGGIQLKWVVLLLMPAHKHVPLWPVDAGHCDLGLGWWLSAANRVRLAVLRSHWVHASPSGIQYTPAPARVHTPTHMRPHACAHACTRLHVRHEDMLLATARTPSPARPTAFWPVAHRGAAGAQSGARQRSGGASHC